MAQSMPSRVRNALKLYLNQTERHSLRQLAEQCSHNSIKASLPTLKRWPSRYRWQRHMAEHDRVAAKQSMATVNQSAGCAGPFQTD